VKHALLWAVVALPLAAQPKLLTNARVDTRSAAAGLEQQFRPLVAAQPQPAWIAYSVPAVPTDSLGCAFVSHDGWSAPGVVHLEPPDRAIILFRVEANAVERIRALSPDCEIDAGGVPVHWLENVNPAQSVALLSSFDTGGAVSAIAVHADPSADAALDRFAAADRPQSLRIRAINWLGAARGRHGFEALKNLIASDPDERVRERAVNALAYSKEPEAVQLLIATARTDGNPRLRAQAASTLGRKPAAQVLDTLTAIIAADPDSEVQHRAVSALRELPDGQGVPALIDLVKNSKSPDLRKRAMSALEQTRDPRALAFFEEVLR
jgi:hypothetical protein